MVPFEQARSQGVPFCPQMIWKSKRGYWSNHRVYLGESRKCYRSNYFDLTTEVTASTGTTTTMCDYYCPETASEVTEDHNIDIDV